jgi:hypothetical protein
VSLFTLSPLKESLPALVHDSFTFSNKVTKMFIKEHLTVIKEKKQKKKEKN